jgi:hypothetical protein
MACGDGARAGRLAAFEDFFNCGARVFGCAGGRGVKVIHLTPGLFPPNGFVRLLLLDCLVLPSRRFAFIRGQSAFPRWGNWT